MDMRLELIQVPVSDLDKAKAFYERVGFAADQDARVSEEIRFIQLTPPGSGCSIALTTGTHDMRPGSLEGLQLVVEDADAVREELSSRGIEVGEVQEFPWGRFVFFSDPDGNAWAVQQPPTWA
jgi:predicted enzyme related to lactoylglutathione lyase